MNGHHIAHYCIGGLALIFACGSFYRAENIPTRPVVMQSVPLGLKGGRATWDGLGQDRTIAIGEALKDFQDKAQLTIYCDNLDCDALMHDIDDALQIADWPSEFERAHVDAESDRGLFIGPSTSPAAQAIKKALADLNPKWAEMPSLGIIIGKKP